MSSLTAVLLFLGAAVVVWLLFGRGGADAEAVQAIEDGALVLDVRTPAEFATGHVRDAVNIPVQELGVRIGELGEPRKVVVYCRSGMRSGRAAGVLKAAGFEVVDAKRLSALPAELRQG